MQGNPLKPACLGIQIAQCITLIMENHMEEQMNNKMELGVYRDIQGSKMVIFKTLRPNVGIIHLLGSLG